MTRIFLCSLLAMLLLVAPAQAQVTTVTWEKGMQVTGPPLFAVANFAPGDSVASVARLENLSEEPVEFIVQAEFESGSSQLFAILRLEVLRDGDLCYGGKLADLDKVSLGTLKEGENTELTFVVTMPEEADNNYQGLSTSLNFFFAGREKWPLVPVTGTNVMWLLPLGLLSVCVGFVMLKAKGK